jgi:hypothetical protein
LVGQNIGGKSAIEVLKHCGSGACG